MCLVFPTSIIGTVQKCEIHKVSEAVGKHSVGYAAEVIDVYQGVGDVIGL